MVTTVDISVGWVEGLVMVMTNLMVDIVQWVDINMGLLVNNFEMCTCYLSAGNQILLVFWAL